MTEELDIRDYTRTETVQVVQFNGDNGDDIQQWARWHGVDIRPLDDKQPLLRLTTSNGSVFEAKVGDYVVKDERHRFSFVMEGRLDLVYSPAEKSTTLIERDQSDR